MLEDHLAILGVDPGADERTIKRAYAKLIKVQRPDVDPAGFQRLTDAFESALRSLQARSSLPMPLHPLTRDADAEPVVAREAASDPDWPHDDQDDELLVDLLAHAREDSAEEFDQWLRWDQRLDDDVVYQRVAELLPRILVAYPAPLSDANVYLMLLFFGLVDDEASQTEPWSATDSRHEWVRKIANKSEEDIDWPDVTDLARKLDFLRNPNVNWATYVTSLWPIWVNDVQTLVDESTRANGGIVPPSFALEKLAWLRKVRDTTCVGTERFWLAAMRWWAFSGTVLTSLMAFSGPAALPIAALVLAALVTFGPWLRWSAAPILLLGAPMMAVADGRVSETTAAGLGLALAALPPLLWWLIATATARIELPPATMRHIQGGVRLLPPLLILAGACMVHLPTQPNAAPAVAAASAALLMLTWRRPGSLLAIVLAMAFPKFILELYEPASAMRWWYVVAASAALVYLSDRIQSWMRKEPLAEIAERSTHVVFATLLALVLACGLLLLLRPDVVPCAGEPTGATIADQAAAAPENAILCSPRS
jgi:hypothetical protein